MADSYTGSTPPGMIVVVGTFEQLARAAFGDVATRHDLAVVSTSESTWSADVCWVGQSSSLRVSDDRRDQFVQVLVGRDVAAGDLEDRRLAVASGQLVIPLWAMCESGGGSPGDAWVSGDEAQRHEALPQLAQVTERYAARFLDGDWSTVMDAYAAMVRSQWESSEEARKAHRFLP